MVIFNPYVSLPEGIYIYMSQSWGLISPGFDQFGSAQLHPKYISKDVGFNMCHRINEDLPFNYGEIYPLTTGTAPPTTVAGL
jgi:hypothetical protein